MAKTKILIAIDEPDWAKTIVHAAYNFMDRKNSEVTLLNVIETNIAEEGYFYSQPEKFIAHEAEKENFIFLENFLENSEVDYKGFLYKEGNAAETIIKLTEKMEYDLLVIGSHNKNAIERFLLGSVAYKVTRFGKSSVLVVDSKCHIKTSGEFKIFSVLMGVDASKNSFYAAENLWKFIDKDRAKLTLLNTMIEPSLIIPPDAYIYLDMNKIIEEACLVSENLLNLTANKLEEHEIKVVKKYHIEGDAAATIIDEAEKNKNDLIVVGSHGGGEISRWLLGSVSTKVYEHAKQPVLIIKQS
ncbi:MAG: hypothetical protein A2104_00645 [Candidatus Melainabacteria bacterium GWF2_32_7]|nr:MAG: hypothetical protein A2104_00645 [Candidatus Melainabacteria bacterium GWF2_32_7]